jgi:hypothetical protein
VFLIVQLQTAPLDAGVPASQLHWVLIFLMLIALPMIPYLFLYLSLREKHIGAPKPATGSPFRELARKIAASFHVHRHPQPLHH